MAEGGSPEGGELAVRGVAAETERIITDPSTSVRKSAGCPQVSSVSGGEAASAGEDVSEEARSTGPPLASSLIIPGSSGNEEGLALVINRIERVLLLEGRVGGDKLVAESRDAPEGTAASVNPLLEDGP